MSCENCHRLLPSGACPADEADREPGVLRVALVGNPNVGKSVLFNQLTGAHQIVGNWPGKTVEKMKGRLNFESTEFEIVDLPGTYSISSDIGEEKQVRDYLMRAKPDLIIDVVDSSFLDRNLALTTELLMLGSPMVVSLNLIDQAEKNGIDIDSDALGKALGVPVIRTSGLRGIGVTDLLRVGMLAVRSRAGSHERILHTPRITKIIERIRDSIHPLFPDSPASWLAERLLAGDADIELLLEAMDENLLRSIKGSRLELEREFADNIGSILSSDRFAVAATIVSKSIRYSSEPRITAADKIHNILTHRIYGIAVTVAIAALGFYGIFLFGDSVANLLIRWFGSAQPSFIHLFSDAALGTFIWNGFLGSLISVLSIALPYLVPFFLFLAILEDSGFLARVAFVMDGTFHRIGLHGKAFIPMLLGYSCNVPACMGCRIMETERERLLSIFAVTMIPCAATSVVILGLVGTYVGFLWVVALYAFNIVVLAVLVRAAGAILPGEPVGLIMEMPPLRRPSPKIVLRQSWHRAKDFIYIAVPLLIAVGLFLGALQYLGLMGGISNAMSPITVGWLGLPAFVGILLIFGILRKELTLLLLGSVAGTANFALVMTQSQMIVFTIIVILYIPCVATIGALVREIGPKKAATITLFKIGFAILVGGIAFRLFTLL